MNLIKYIATYIMLIPVSVLTLCQCATAKSSETNKKSMEISEIYYQDSQSDNGVNVYVVIKHKKDHVILNDVFFRGKQADLRAINDTLYVGYLKLDTVHKEDIIMSNKPNAEFGNTVPKIPKTSTYNLKENECIISYKAHEEVLFLKYENVIKR
ncbi:hypothetical protein [Aestuariibaculum sediminum]|uniref:Lipoprotein n=1 Tax=Aestuariibaculum sediminum TaxID=2770637 RepID=A0A8J6Q1R1_9FLAO|nr:hypothetical protein [Aestuariibaculum sediminum]MBD0831176.1 hypothetical protein [Aestuariibaculum sediminum]